MLRYLSSAYGCHVYSLYSLRNSTSVLLPTLGQSFRKTPMITAYEVLGSFQNIATSDSSNVSSSSLAMLFGTNKHVSVAFSPGNNMLPQEKCISFCAREVHLILYELM